MTGKKVARREFVADTGKIGLGVMIVPRHVLGGLGYQAPATRSTSPSSGLVGWAPRTRSLTETMLLGIVALRTGQGRKILYDGVQMLVTNIRDANQYLTREYRAGWEV